jgi:hypothetical protein
LKENFDGKLEFCGILPVEGKLKMADFKLSMKKLDGENYFSWKFPMQLLLQRDKVWYTVVEKKPEEAKGKAKWEIDDMVALSTIGLLVEEDQQCHIRYAKSAKEAWDALASIYEKPTLTNKVSLMRQICGMRFVDGDNMEKHVGSMIEKFQKLRDLGEKMSDNWSIAFLLSSLPSSYDAMVMALETRDERDLTLGLVKSKVIDEWRRKTRNEEEIETVNRISSKARNRGERKEMGCFICKSRDHWKKDCPIRKDSRKEKEAGESSNFISEESFLFAIGETGSDDGWVLDSAASCLVSNEKEVFENFDPYHIEKLEIANGQTITAKGKGTVRMEIMNSEGGVSKAVLTDVLYTPDVRGKFMSVQKLVEKGFEVKFGKNAGQILWKGKQIGYRIC